MPYHLDRKSTRLNSSHTIISYAVFCLKKTNSSARGRCGARSGGRAATSTRSSLRGGVGAPARGIDPVLGEAEFRAACRPGFFLRARLQRGGWLLPYRGTAD